ncbi:F-type conjugal transfer pilus assembly protein TraB (plasmid) [Kosakonia sp. ML.JS2a]|uniref:F-type conjugal transfer pilus assembly protein TraB n=1 Tax=Kosakonia sp. ML.JS2a TaxID=2980557 RepID=UPI0021DA5C2E|nr:F-type conjugal transfer pilus assembly protein TraB [Kosakonia sp. ML.JS2a]UXY13576.1 F-type conjugal transfer pilus assembly protein TraB [Kosakonia sp. ML.JS2a]
MNINVKTRRRQLAILIGVLVTGGLAAAAVMTWGNESSKPRTATNAPAPNMTGVVTATFDEQVNQSAMTQQQAKTSALEAKLAGLEQTVKQNQQEFSTQLQKKDDEIRRLSELLPKPGAPGSNGQPTGQQPPPAAPDGTPLPGPVAAGQARPPQYSVTPVAGTPSATGAAGNQGTGFYPGGSGARMTGGLEKTTFNYDSLKKKATRLPWISSGSFSEAVMIEGADANASVTGQQNSRPVTFRLRGKTTMPNNKEYDMDGCFVVGEIWGDISSERGEVRTRSISCNLKNGKDIDMAFNGHVSYQGKGGIKGTPVMRNGKIIGYAGAAGFLSGIGEGVKSAATPSVGLGATANVSAGDVLGQGLGGGGNKAAETLSQYFIKRAEQYHPVIDIGAGNLVTVVFQDGFQLETRQDSEEEKAKAAAQKAGETVKNAATGNNASSATTTTTSTSSVGNIDPDEVLRQARGLKLGDTIN